MLKIEDRAKCSGCHACALVCPQNCITMAKDSESFLYPQIDKSFCINCGLCEKCCPVINPVVSKKKESEIITYAAYSKNKSVRLASSSGGIFTEIAFYVIAHNGVVFGAAFDDTFNVRHICVDTVAGLVKLRGSKYVQSEIGNAYRDAEEHLKNGEPVLFTGTPCQIAGFYRYMKKDYEKLLTQDMICHGVPSPLVFHKYLLAEEKKQKATISEVQFRNKEQGWERFCLKLCFSNGTYHSKMHKQDTFMKAFLRDLCLRPSCYACAFKNKIRESDFTLADFWGIDNIVSNMNDDYGTSLVFVNSQKASVIFEKIHPNIEYREVPIDSAIRYNSSMLKSADQPQIRDEFMKNAECKSFRKLEKKYLESSFFQKVNNKIKKSLKKLY